VSPALRSLQRWLVSSHRWLAIATCLLFVAWFASGLVMIYVPFPALTGAERLAHLERIDWQAVKVLPQQALELAGVQEFPRELRLEMMAGEPVWRIRERRGWEYSFSAVDGELVSGLRAEDALRVVNAAAPGVQPRFIETLERDQWTVASTFDQHRPLHRIALDDDAGTELYVSSRTGEIVLDTTWRERFWNWPGAVLHWFYFEELRGRRELWRQVILWTSGVGIYVAVTGLWLGIDRLRLRKRYPTGKVTPYRGWMAWHHLAGVAGGVFLLTWVFSGWLSVSPPVPWAGEPDARLIQQGLDAYAGNSDARFALNPALLPSLERLDAREARFEWLAGRPRIVITDAQSGRTVLDAGTGAPVTYSQEQLIENARLLVPGANLHEATLLTSEDAYWYSRRVPRRLPVLRVKFDDEHATWIHIDAATGAVLGRMHAGDRVNRWLFDALHSFDFAWLRAHRPAWDIVMWVLSIAGLVISVSGVVIGWRRLRAR